jgi:hypothetical protein
VNAITVRDLQVAIVDAAVHYGRAAAAHARALAHGDSDAAARAGHRMEQQMKAIHQLPEDLAQAVRQEAVR